MSRPWVKLHTSGLTSERLLDLSPAGSKLWFMSMMRAAQEEREGRVVAAPVRSVARWSGLDAGDVPAAVEELVEVGLWELDGEDAVLLRWLEFQPTEAEWGNKRVKDAARQARRRERQRAQAAVPAVEAAVAPSAAPQEPESLSGAQEMRAAIVAACDATDGSCGDYMAVLAEARALAADAEAAGAATPKLRAYLEQAVVGHVAGRFYEGRIVGRQFGPLFRLCNQVGADHVLWALVECAAKDLDEKGAYPYVAKVARNHAEERS